MTTNKVPRSFAAAIIAATILSVTFPVAGQDATSQETFKPYLTSGFNLLLHNGIWGSTVPARPEGGKYYPTGGDPYTGLGLGVNIDYRLLDYFAFHFDINTYFNKTPLAYSGGYASSDWVWEMNDYSQRLVGPFAENVNYEVNSTGMRLGLKAFLPMKNKRVEPWLGVYYGYWTYNLGVFSEDKKSTYGNTSGSAHNLMYLNVGIDIWDKTHSFGATIFFEGGSPVARNYSIENCLVTGWTFQDYGEGTHLFGYYRLGIALNMVNRRTR